MNKPIEGVMDIATVVGGISNYLNTVLSTVNDHVIRVAVMTEPFFWHRHPNSDETFLVMEGSIYIDLEGRSIQLFPGQLFTVSKNIRHRTRPGTERSVNITIEKTDMITLREDELG